MIRKAKSFEYTEYKANWEKRELEFKYKITFEDNTNEEFIEKLFLPIDSGQARMTENDTLTKVLQNLHLILGISYYKLYCPVGIKLNGFSLTKEQADFWNTVYTKGLGEFFYKNEIDYRGLVKFPFNETKQILNQVQDDTNPTSDERNSTPGVKEVPTPGVGDKALVAIGGGKDSIVTAEILKKNNIECTAFTLVNHNIQKQVIEALGLPTIEVRRQLDPKLLELNESGTVYNGHIPISAIYAFVSLLVGVLYGFRYLVFSNERSSNYGNVSYLGAEINHQWSKSEEFELLFQNYIHDYVTPDVTYFSLLRPLYEIDIVRRFAELPQYHTIFSSCNRNFAQNLTVKDGRDPSIRQLADFGMTEKLWCGKCAKCAFVFCLLSAFLSKTNLIAIFGKNLYDDESLVATYKQLLGLTEMKPFDCVGTPEETEIALYMAYQKGEYNDSKIVKMFEVEVLPQLKNIEELEKKAFAIYESNNIPQVFRNMV